MPKKERCEVLISRSVRKITLQFSVTSAGLIPASLKHKEPDPNKKIWHGRNKCVLKPKENCRISNLPRELEKIGFVLANAFWQQRKKYCVARFAFSRQGRAVDNSVREGLQKMVDSYLWRVWALDFGNVIGIYTDSHIPVHLTKASGFLHIAA